MMVKRLIALEGDTVTLPGKPSEFIPAVSPQQALCRPGRALSPPRA